MIKSIQLENWKSHENTELEFTKGTTVLIGQMGAGKTSVMDAISFALFGTFPALNSRKLKLDQCIMDKPEKKNHSKITLSFTLNKSEYEVTREIERGKGTTIAEFKKDDSVVENNSQRVTEAISKELQVDYELFSRAVYSEQNQIDYFLQIPSGQRKKKIDELLKLDRFEKARSTTTSIINRLKNQAKDKQQALRELGEEDVGKKLKELEGKLEKMLEENRKMGKKLEEKNKNLEKLTKEVNTLEEKQEKTRTLENQVNSLKGEVNTLEEKTSSIKSKLGKFLEIDLTTKKTELKKRAAGIKHQIASFQEERLQKDLSLLSSELGSLRARGEDLQKKAEEKEMLSEKFKELEKENWKEKFEQKKKELRELEEHLTESQLKVNSEEKRLKQLGDLQERCPVCDSQISQEKRKELENKSLKVIVENKRKVHELKERIERIDLNALEKKNQELENIKEKLTELDVKKQLAQVKEQIVITKKQLEAKKKEQKTNADKKKELEKEKEETAQKLNKMERIEELQKEHRESIRTCKEKKEKLTELEKQVKAIEFHEEELKKKREQKEELRISVSQIKTQLDSNDKLAEEKNQRTKELQTIQEQIKEWKDSLEFLKETSASMDVFRNALEATQIQLREETLLALNAGTEDLWPRIYPYGDYTSLRLEVEGGDYILQVKRRDGSWVNVEGIASGGERSTACLALRIAFSLVLTQNLSWLVLDEPTHNLDSQGIATLSKALREHLPELVEQVFIITHEEEMESAVSGTLYRFERQKELDEPTKAILLSTGS